jgi:pimeloyl-ACP methyl ester carboxylesterase
VHAHLIEGAGHWVHVDAPDVLFDQVAAALT